MAVKVWHLGVQQILCLPPAHLSILKLDHLCIERRLVVMTLSSRDRRGCSLHLFWTRRSPDLLQLSGSKPFLKSACPHFVPRGQLLASQLKHLHIVKGLTPWVFVVYSH